MLHLSELIIHLHVSSHLASGFRYEIFSFLLFSEKGKSGLLKIPSEDVVNGSQKNFVKEFDPVFHFLSRILQKARKKVVVLQEA